MRLLILVFFIVAFLQHELLAQVRGTGGTDDKSTKLTAGKVQPRNQLTRLEPAQGGRVTITTTNSHAQASGSRTPLVPPLSSTSTNSNGPRLPKMSTKPAIPSSSRNNNNQATRPQNVNPVGTNTENLTPIITQSLPSVNSNAGNSRASVASSSQAQEMSENNEYYTYQFSLVSENKKAPLNLNDQEQQIKPKVLSETECSIQLNEIFIGSIGSMQYIELKRRCGRLAKAPITQNLNGYIIVAVDWTDSPRIVLTINLNDKRLVKRVEANGENEYFVVGAPRTHVDMTLGDLKSPKKVQYPSYPSLVDMLPDEMLGTVSLFLLYFPVSHRKDIALFDLPSVKGANLIFQFQPLPLSDEHKNIIKCRILDGLVYGLESKEFPIFVSNTLGLRAPPLFTGYEAGLDISISRCGSEFLDHDSFRYLPTTPGVDNNCPAQTSEHKLPFPSFKGIVIPAVAQKFAVNLHYSLSVAKRNLILKGPPSEVTSRLLGISIKKLYNILKNYKSNTIKTPSRRQPNRPKPVQQSIDGLDREVIKTQIANKYKQGIAPYFRDIYNDFIQYKRQGCVRYTTSSAELSITRFLPLCTPAPIVSQVLQLSNQVSNPVCQGGSETVSRATHTANDDPLYNCHEITFKKVLKGMGFRYGKINGRIMLIQRPDIVAWRTRYLRKLADNSKRDKPLKLLWTDETWLEQNRRSDKGWRIHRPANYKESAMYSFPTNKIGHGHRSVVVAAGTEDGIIKDSILLYEIKKSSVDIDYHRNIDSETYMRWFKKLILTLNASGEKYLIIMDNASYHASSNAPKSGTRKNELYRWVKDISERVPEAHVSVPDISRITVAELWVIVRSLKEREEMKEHIFEVDKFARENGHEVLRLPPYNCHLNPIEFLWSIVKRRVAARNTNQNIKDVLKIADETLRTMDPQIFRNQIQHCLKLGEKHKIEDGYIENESVPVPVVINMNEESDDDSDSNESSFCSDSETEEIDLQPLDMDPEELETTLGHEEHATWQAGLSPPPAAPPKRPRFCFSDLRRGFDPYEQ